MFGSDAIAGVVSIMSSMPHSDDGKNSRKIIVGISIQ
jgi:hypothetical protein